MSSYQKLITDVIKLTSWFFIFWHYFTSLWILWDIQQLNYYLKLITDVISWFLIFWQHFTSAILWDIWQQMNCYQKSIADVCKLIWGFISLPFICRTLNKWGIDMKDLSLMPNYMGNIDCRKNINFCITPVSALLRLLLSWVTWSLIHP